MPSNFYVLNILYKYTRRIVIIIIIRTFETYYFIEIEDVIRLLFSSLEER